jgi:predicted RNA-binding protein associated with RNAse of E/G family
MRAGEMTADEEHAPTISVLKLDLSGATVRRYEGRLVRRDDHRVVIEAPFIIDVERYVLLDVVLKRGDRFVETYYDDRCYNVYEIFDRDDGQLKGWYCNLSRPAHIALNIVSWVDLALDLWVWPDGRSEILDQDEFDLLPLDAEEREQIGSTVLHLRHEFSRGRPPP